MRSRCEASTFPPRFLRQTPPVEAAVLDRLAHVARFKRTRAREIGDGARDLENAVIRAGRQGQPRDRRAQQRVRTVRHAAERPDVARRHVRVGVYAGARGEALALHRPGPAHALPHGLAYLTPALVRERAVLHRWDLEVEVDP